MLGADLHPRAEAIPWVLEVRVIPDRDVQAISAREQRVDGIASLRLVRPHRRAVLVVRLDRVEQLGGQAVEVEEVRQARMQQHEIRAGVRRTTDGASVRFIIGRRGEVRGHADRVDPIDVLVVPVG